MIPSDVLRFVIAGLTRNRKRPKLTLVNKDVAKRLRQTLLKINDTANKIKSQQQPFPPISIFFSNNLEILYPPDDMLYLHAYTRNLLVCRFACGLLLFT